jgi:hypothetical protein
MSTSPIRGDFNHINVCPLCAAYCTVGPATGFCYKCGQYLPLDYAKIQQPAEVPDERWHARIDNRIAALRDSDSYRASYHPVRNSRKEAVMSTNQPASTGQYVIKHAEDGHAMLIRTSDNHVVYEDGGEPEDMLLTRDLGVFVTELNAASRAPQVAALSLDATYLADTLKMALKWLVPYAPDSAIASVTITRLRESLALLAAQAGKDAKWADTDTTKVQQSELDGRITVGRIGL